MALIPLEFACRDPDNAPDKLIRIDALEGLEVVPGLVELQLAVPHLRSACAPTVRCGMTSATAPP